MGHSRMTRSRWDRVRRGQASFSLLLALLASSARASELSAVQVTQLVGGTGEGPLIAQVLYLGYFTVVNPYAAVWLTARENMLAVDRGKQFIENHNIAHELGIRIEIRGVQFETLDEAIASYARRETLEVTMGVPPAEEPDRPGSARERERHTRGVLECLLENARRYWPRVRHVSLTVTGDPAFSSLSGEYPLEHVPEPTKIRLVPRPQR